MSRDAVAPRRIGRPGVRKQAEAWWLQLPEAVRSPAWPLALAVLTVIFLLLAFHQVVRDAVRQGEMLRSAAAIQSEAAWRCSASPRTCA